jgi:transposase
MDVFQGLLEPCDRNTYGDKLRAAAEKLDKTVRTVQRLVKKYQQDGLSAIVETQRNDKGSYRIDPEWQKFIITTFKEGNKGSKKMTPAQVAMRVQVRAEQLGLQKYPSHMRVYRAVNPIIERQEQKQKQRNIGWRGSRVSHKTRDGQTLDLLQQTGQITVMMLDNASVHKSHLVRSRIDDWQQQGLYLFFLPPYSPQLNRIEDEWLHLKRDELSGQVFDNEYDECLCNYGWC